MRGGLRQSCCVSLRFGPIRPHEALDLVQGAHANVPAAAEVWDKVLVVHGEHAELAFAQSVVTEKLADVVEK